MVSSLERRGRGNFLRCNSNDFYSRMGKDKYVHTLGTSLKLLLTLRLNALKSNKPISEQSTAPWPWPQVSGPILSQNPSLLPQHSEWETAENCPNNINSNVYTCTQTHVRNTQAWWRWCMLPHPLLRPCSWSGDSEEDIPQRWLSVLTRARQLHYPCPSRGW